jgi:hypothetical protein
MFSAAAAVLDAVAVSAAPLCSAVAWARALKSSTLTWSWAAWAMLTVSSRKDCVSGSVTPIEAAGAPRFLRESGDEDSALRFRFWPGVLATSAA